MLLTAFVVPSSAAAAEIDVGLAPLAESGLGTTDIRVTIANIIRVFLGLLGTIAVVLILYGGFLWTTAAGNEERIEKAKKLLINAAIGLAIVLLAFTITSFILRSILEGTGVEVGGGEGPGVPSGGGGLPANAFIVKGMTPQGDIPIRNVVVRLVFSRAVNEDSLKANATVAGQDSGTVVEGTWTVDGTNARFVPEANCPEPNQDRKCFPENKQFRVELKGGSGGVKSNDANSSDLLCGIGAASCRWFFTTGDLVDTQDPHVVILLPVADAFVSADTDVSFTARATDEAGLSVIDYFVNDERLDTIALVRPYPKEQTETVLWNTRGLEKNSQQKLSVRVFDIDGNEFTTEIRVRIRAAHCYNEVKDTNLTPATANETGIDCGGDDCAACAGQQCGDDRDCASGACVENKCVEFPTIESFDPVDGAAKTDTAPGAFVTITGKRFEAYEAGPKKSRVIFLGDVADPADDVPATFPDACGSQTLWTDKRIVVEVPKGAKTGPIQVFSKNNLFDRTDNDRGIKSDFTINTKVRPGLCSVNPNHGEFGTVVTLVGAGFGVTRAQDDRVEFGRIGSGGTIEWSDGQIRGVQVPNLREGETDARVNARGVFSNPVPFLVEPSKSTPQILEVNPGEGPVGQYVFIRGNNFGASVGKIFFGEYQFIPDQAFSQVCGNNYWTDSTIIAKVPAMPNDERDKVQAIKIEKSGGQESLPFDFTVTATGTPTPGICRLNPDNGPAGIRVELFGEGFGDAVGKVRFGAEENVAIASWNASTIRATVPPLQTTAPVAVHVVKDKTLSNKVLFTVRDCRGAQNACRQGEECCGDGACRQEGQCVTGPIQCRYSWQFTTGKSTRKPCDTTLDCSGGEICEEETKTCVINGGGGDDGGRRCSNDLQCGTDGTCGSLGLCVESIPRVVEHPTCSVGFTQSPSPFRDTNTACRNAVIAVKFNTDMDDASVRGPGNITVKQCNQDAKFNAGTCATSVPVKSYGVPLRDTQSERFQWIPDGKLLEKNTWYEVTLKSGEEGMKGISGKELDGNGDGEAGGDYVWHFRVKGDDALCTMSELRVIPESWAMTRRDETKEYAGLPLVANCNELIPENGMTVSATSSDPSKATVSDVDANYGAIATGLNETLPGQPVTIQMTATAPSGSKTGSGKLTINFPDLEVVQPFPFCEAACVNAQLGARFSTDLASPLPLPIVFRCADSQCLKQPKVPFPDSPVVIPLRGGRIEGNTMLLFGDLPRVPDARYRVVIQKQHTRSIWGRPLQGLNYDYNEDGLLDSYSWTFKVKKDLSLCQIGSVEVQPERAEKLLIGDTESYLSIPRGSPDSCDPHGQMLTGDTYGWNWTSDPEAIASVENVDQLPTPPDGRVDPVQTAELKAPGEAIIRAATEGKSGEGSLALRCGYTDARQCPGQRFDSDKRPHWYGVGYDTCCNIRPRLQAADVIPKGNNVCRNAVLEFPFTQALDVTSLQGNIIVHDIAGPSCSHASPCPVRGRVIAKSGQEGRTIAVFLPEQLLQGGHTYRWDVMGDTFGVSSSANRIRNKAGIVVPYGTTNFFTVVDRICQIERVDLTVAPSPGRADDLFACAGRNDCPGDEDPRDGNQHVYAGQAKDSSGVPLQANYQWSSSHPRVTLARRCAITPATPDTAGCVDVCGRSFEYRAGACISTDESILDSQSVFATPKPESGDADIRVTADPPQYIRDVDATAKSASRRMRAEVFLCENPWPSLATFPYTEPETNFSLFYCRDQGKRGAEDDLPNILGVTSVPPSSDFQDKGVEYEWHLPIR